MRRQKDFPRFVKITPRISYSVKFKRGLENRGYMGLCFYDKKEIWISMGLSAKDRLSTFCHEVAHSVSHEYGLDLSHQTIYDLEGPLAFFLSRNTAWIHRT